MILMEEKNNTIDSEYEWENQAANISHHVKTSNEKKKDDVEVLALDLDGVRVLTEKSMMSELTNTTSKVVSNSTIHISSLKTNATNHRLTTEGTTLTKMATDRTTTIKSTSTPPTSTGKRDSLKATLKLEVTNSTDTLSYWDLLPSWLPQVWK